MIIFKEEGNFQEGALILVDKPLKWTSFDVVNKIRWCLHQKYGKIKVGHAGTLDPLATGLMLVCVGKWTKQIEAYMAQEKQYIADIRFGWTTPSFDLETVPDREYSYQHITREMLDDVLLRFTGEIKQYPPVFSAVRVDGKRAYQKARQGVEVKMPLKEVFIKRLEVLDFNLPDLRLKIDCGKGTYVRSLANDIGAACQSGAFLAGLCRTGIGTYRIENANKMDEVVGFLQTM